MDSDAKENIASATVEANPDTETVKQHALPHSVTTPTPVNNNVKESAQPAVGQQKTKRPSKSPTATKKNDANGGKKPSPRVRTANKDGKKATPTNGQKRIASPGGRNSNTRSPGTGESSLSNATPSSVTSDELPPMQDPELRKIYLHRIYRQLQTTHPNQGDAIIRQLATNIEMGICRRAATRSEYLTMLNAEIHKLMEAELSHGAVPGRPAVNSYQNYIERENAPFSSSGMQSLPGGYTQSQTHPQGQFQGLNAAPNQQATEGSFVQSLMPTEHPMYTYGQGNTTPYQNAQSVPNIRAQNQSPQQVNGRRHPQDQIQNTRFPPQVQRNTSSGTNIPHPQVFHHLQQQNQQLRQQNPGPTFQEFTAQIQHFDKGALIELLWNQRNALIHWQKRASQLEAQVNARQAPSYNSLMSASPYYNSPTASVPPYGATGRSSNSSEAEIQRPSERTNQRILQQQQYHPYSQHSQYPAATAPNVVPAESGSANTGSNQVSEPNPVLYWEKVRNLKGLYTRHLFVAHRALSQHSAPPNSAQRMKAENVNHNISLAMSVLNEVPKNLQPRPFEVLDSIERFILNTVIPIVQKVESSISPQQHVQQAFDQQKGIPPSNETSVMSAATVIPTDGRVENSSNTPMNTQVLPGPRESAPNSLTAARSIDDSNASAAENMESTSGYTNVRSEDTNVKSSPAKKNEDNIRLNSAKLLDENRSIAHVSPSGARTPIEAGEAVHPTPIQPTQPPAAQNPIYSALIEGNGTLKTASSRSPSKKISAKDNLTNVEATKSGLLPEDDSLNDFSDFPELDFDEDLQDPIVKAQQNNKENNSSRSSRKRTFADI